MNQIGNVPLMTVVSRRLASTIGRQRRLRIPRLHLVHRGFLTGKVHVALAWLHPWQVEPGVLELTRPTNLVLGAATVPLGAAMVLGDDWTSEASRPRCCSP